MPHVQLSIVPKLGFIVRKNQKRPVNTGQNGHNFSTARKNRNCEIAGVKQIRIHDFRHSCASLLIYKGANIITVSKFLGHTKIEETLNTYTHLYKNALTDITALIDDMNNEQKSNFQLY